MENKSELDAAADKVVYTGPIDAFYDYLYGNLQYRSLRFETEVLNVKNYQGVAGMNFTDRETPYTRIVEHKHFEFGEQDKTVITKEYSVEWTPGMEPYYPVNDEVNTKLYAMYKELADKETKVKFGGRLGEYKYYDMDAVIASARRKRSQVSRICSFAFNVKFSSRLHSNYLSVNKLLKILTQHNISVN